MPRSACFRLHCLSCSTLCFCFSVKFFVTHASVRWRVNSARMQVQKWTKGVDLLKKDFWFIPIHERFDCFTPRAAPFPLSFVCMSCRAYVLASRTLVLRTTAIVPRVRVNIHTHAHTFPPFFLRSMHWSLAIVCHPGLALGISSPAAEQLPQGSLPGQHPTELNPAPCILHLDSLDCHPTDEVVTRIRAYATLLLPCTLHSPHFVSVNACTSCEYAQIFRIEYAFVCGPCVASLV